MLYGMKNPGGTGLMKLFSIIFVISGIVITYIATSALPTEEDQSMSDQLGLFKIPLLSLFVYFSLIGCLYFGKANEKGIWAAIILLLIILITNLFISPTFIDSYF